MAVLDLVQSYGLPVLGVFAAIPLFFSTCFSVYSVVQMRKIVKKTGKPFSEVFKEQKNILYSVWTLGFHRSIYPMIVNRIRYPVPRVGSRAPTSGISLYSTEGEEVSLQHFVDKAVAANKPLVLNFGSIT